MIAILISTTYKRLSNIQSHQFPVSDKLNYIISCQGEKEHNDDFYISHLDKVFSSNSYVLLHLKKSGLSNNRNNCLSYFIKNDTNSTHCYIADDDISIIKENLFTLKDIASKNNIDLAIGKVITDNESKIEYKNYPDKQFFFSLISASKISSVEMLISKSILLKTKVEFDKNFGLGTTFPSGEEYIFSTDIIKKKGKVCFFPINICIHPMESSGKDFFSSRDKIQAKGAMLCRIFGSKKAKLLALIWAIKKHTVYKKYISFFSFKKTLFSGIENFSSLNK
ncbi:hypothetical protein L3033_002800 [Providencia stuartii]|nr:MULTISPECIES: hypothetical protein [Providencia]APG51984.1 hypothetical protein BGK56_13865 [Providencia stuartii]AVL41774.1 hypothetical protein CEP70_18285 [Providencia stuartii]AXO19360.1 hypothetical protein MC79_012535 [Providencia stuartii]MBG5906027.1 hypothetical protein [Providencia stuartii]MBG5913703.1 hypothetical protein [Providencia stuartii]